MATFIFKESQISSKSKESNGKWRSRTQNLLRLFIYLFYFFFNLNLGESAGHRTNFENFPNLTCWLLDDGSFLLDLFETIYRDNVTTLLYCMFWCLTLAKKNTLISQHPRDKLREKKVHFLHRTTF